ncbi:hypothetical protein LTR85_012296 [Meristemomyces frigidus]|nr:hypothetical protein LTR85_012296 [Meristemomyces frigidus]
MTLLDSWTRSSSYVVGYRPSQADVKSFQAISALPHVQKYPHAYRWYKHIRSFEPDFSSLPSDPTKEFTTYGPQSSELTTNLAKGSENGKTLGKEENEGGDDNDVDLFGSDDEEEDAEAEKVKAERLAEYQKKKVGKAKPAAKSIVTLDTDMNALEEAVRSLNKDGLVWGRSKLVPVGFGIKKLQINLVVEDDKISLDEL